MSEAIEHLVDQFEARTLTRRQLVASLTGLIAGASLDASAQPTAPSQVAQGRTINHVSLSVADVERSADF
jgi:hypothetical protein